MNISKKEGCLSDDEYYTKVDDAITGVIVKVQDDTNEVNKDTTIQVL